MISFFCFFFVLFSMLVHQRASIDLLQAHSRKSLGPSTVLPTISRRNVQLSSSISTTIAPTNKTSHVSPVSSEDSVTTLGISHRRNLLNYTHSLIQNPTITNRSAHWKIF